MRPVVQPEGLLERIALGLNLAPFPAIEAMGGMMSCRIIMAGIRLGIYESLSGFAHLPRTLAEERKLDPAGTKLLLDSLVSIGHVRVYEGSSYTLTRRARKWLDPASPTYIGGFLEFNYDQWEWWSRLEEVLQTGRPIEIHDFAPGDPRWERYITAMFQLARLSGPEIAAKLRLPPSPTRLLDLAGGHGWYAAELCKRHLTLRAMVLDLPGSAEIGRRIISDCGMSERVEHVEGDLMTADLGGPYDGALCFQIMHHLDQEENLRLLRRVREALSPGGTLAILDSFAPEAGQRPDDASLLGLHFYLTSAATTYTEKEIRQWVQEAGFATCRTISLQRMPLLKLLEAKS